jgi:hypothetical protein
MRPPRKNVALHPSLTQFYKLRGTYVRRDKWPKGLYEKMTKAVYDAGYTLGGKPRDTEIAR